MVRMLDGETGELAAEVPGPFLDGAGVWRVDAPGLKQVRSVIFEALPPTYPPPFVTPVVPSPASPPAATVASESVTVIGGLKIFGSPAKLPKGYKKPRGGPTGAR